MVLHRNAKLGLAGRLALVQAIEGGLPLRRAAARFGVSPATAHRCWQRWRRATVSERETLACLLDRSSCPQRQPRRLSAAEEEAILRVRRETNLGPARVGALVRRAASTVWKVLRRHGLSRRRRGERQTYRRYEWSTAGALLHMDVKELPRFRHPGHRATGSRSEKERSRDAGYDYLHCVVDDHTRPYVELHPRENAETNARTLERALRFFAELGLEPEAVMTDNAFVYTRARRFRALLQVHGLRHIVTPKYTPRWNGKVERFIQTLQNEWAYVRTWESSSERARALSSFIRFYNRQRAHSSLGGQAPISRVHNLCG